MPLLGHHHKQGKPVYTSSLAQWTRISRHYIIKCSYANLIHSFCPSITCVQQIDIVQFILQFFVFTLYYLFFSDTHAVMDFIYNCFQCLLLINIACVYHLHLSRGTSMTVLVCFVKYINLLGWVIAHFCFSCM